MFAALLAVASVSPVLGDGRDDGEAAFVEWAKGHAIVLKTTEADRGLEDLRPVGAIVGDARIVALGESTHGTREVFQMKHRMLEFLVREKGFNLFAIEAGMPACAAINDYVLRGEGDAAEALRGLGYWTWDTEEVLDLIRWMRRHNEDPSHVEKVKFYGFDMQSPDDSMRHVLDYLEPSAPDLVARLGTEIEPHLETLYFLLYRKLPDDARATYDRTVSELGDHLDRHRDALIARTSRDAWGLARRQITLLHQADETGRAHIAAQPDIGTGGLRKLTSEAKATTAGLVEYLDAHDPQCPRPIRDFLLVLGASEGAMTKAYKASAEHEDESRRWDALAGAVVGRLEGERGELVGRSSQAEWDRVRARANDVAALVGALRQRTERAEVEPNVRDRCMAENVAWILEHEGPGSKVVTWAHNWHVLKKQAKPGFGRMGTELERLFGGRHFTFGFAFNRGRFQARGLDHGKPGTSVLQEFVVGPAKAGSIDRALAEVGPPLFALDLRGRTPGDAVASWIEKPHPLRDVPAGFDPEDEATYYIDSPVAREFDALIFLESTSRARPNPAPESGLGEPAPEVTAAGLNLDFESPPPPGGVPDGWNMGRESTGYAFAADDAVHDSGARSLRIRREGKGKSGTALRAIPAAGVAGKTLRIRARVRTEGVTRGYAGLLLRAESPGKLLALDNSAIRVDGRGVRSSTEFRGLRGTADWREVTLELVVPPEATVVRFGPILAGNGTAWFDRFSVEVDGEPYAP